MSCKKSISGPYRATKLWNDAVRSFYNGMPVSRHWRGLRQYERCFTASEAVDWLHQHLQSNPNFSRSVSRDQTIKLLRKFVKAGLLEDVRGVTTRPEDFREGRDLYRFSSRSPLKALRTPGRTALAALDPNTPQADLGGSPLLRRYRSSLRQSVRCKRGADRDASPNTDAPAPKARPRRAASLHRGENAANERRAKADQGDRGGKDQGGMQECHLVARPPTVQETNQVWKEVLLDK